MREMKRTMRAVMGSIERPEDPNHESSGWTACLPSANAESHICARRAWHRARSGVGCRHLRRQVNSGDVCSSVYVSAETTARSWIVISARLSG